MAKYSYTASVITALLSTAFSSNAFSEGNFTPFISASALTDSNIYRLDDSISESSLSEDTSKSDKLYRTTVGLNLDWTVSRQAFYVSGSLQDTRYEKNTQLDNLAKNLNARWNWLLGSRLTGIVSASQSIGLSNFEDTGVREKVERTISQLNASGNWRYHPDWQLGLAFRTLDIGYDSETRNVSDLKQLATSVNLDYLVKTGSRIGFKLENEVGEFPNRVNSLFFDDKYTQNSFLLTTFWNISGKSSFNSEFGYVSRSHPDITERDYEGLNATLRYNWAVTTKVNIFAEAFRRTASSEDILASYSENTGTKITAQWIPTDKITVSGLLSKETRDYTGQTGLIPGVDSTLEDRFINKTLSVKYEPHKNFDISLGYTDSSRESNGNLRDYTAEQYSLTLKINL